MAIRSTNAGELRVRVDAVERDISHLDTQISAVRDSMATRGDISSVLNRIEALAAQYSALSKPNYAVQIASASVIMVFLTMVGGFAYWPINNSIQKLEQKQESTVPLSQYQEGQRRQDDDLGRLRSDVQTSIQQQRYNADMGRVNGELESIRQQLRGH